MCNKVQPSKELISLADKMVTLAMKELGGVNWTNLGLCSDLIKEAVEEAVNGAGEGISDGEKAIENGDY